MSQFTNFILLVLLAGLAAALPHVAVNTESTKASSTPSGNLRHVPRREPDTVSCRANSGETGTCMDTARCSGAYYEAGHCPGAAHIQCCVPKPTKPAVQPVACNVNSGDAGTCMNTASCTGYIEAGHCPGASNIKCCVPRAPKPAKPANSTTPSTPSNPTTPTSANFNMAQAIKFANGNCASSPQWLCAEFVARSLHAGGLFPGVSSYFNYKGVNLAWVPSLVPYLQKHGWVALNKGKYGSDPGQAGDILVYMVNGSPLSHVAFSIGPNKDDQHNPNHCNAFSNWGPHMVLRYTGN